MQPSPSQEDVLLYQSPDGAIRLDVQLQHETVWLTQAQMSTLFGKNSDTIGLHVRNIFATGELYAGSTTEYYSVVREEGRREVTRRIAHYNLDVIISVGYRVNSVKGTQFRRWATQVLRDFLVQGYALNERRLRESQRQLADLKRLVQLQGEIAASQELSANQSDALLRILGDYARALDVLDQYDHQRLRVARETVAATSGYELTYEEALATVDALREQYGGSNLFGREKDQSFESSVRTIYQSFGGQDLYPSVEEKAANLLYFVVKNHSFSDGNKRIAAFLFVYFLDRNACLYHPDGTRRLADNALVALTLLIAESKPEDKDTLVTLVVNLINGEN
ncbi:virulence protein RhuM/Fic/DOC family protein [Hymenobacter sp.]|uniref:virulence protein RhuM/Fic/DOC family protein n=1 Tax=Hymenobacter sp. TaxID=1898978 RepID=UPI00286AD881|nr:virulence protein RhuM/Fic/DOC family protein [Hymenobacter sp.]